MGRGLKSCTNYVLMGIPLEKVTAVRHLLKNSKYAAVCKENLLSFGLVTSITICLLLLGAKGQKDAQTELTNHHDSFSLTISRREHLSLCAEKWIFKSQLLQLMSYTWEMRFLPRDLGDYNSNLLCISHELLPTISNIYFSISLWKSHL